MSLRKRDDDVRLLTIRYLLLAKEILNLSYLCRNYY